MLPSLRSQKLNLGGQLKILIVQPDINLQGKLLMDIVAGSRSCITGLFEP